MRRLTQWNAVTPFDLERGPLYRATLLRLAEDECVALLAMHHLISDGWSTGVFVRELAALYRAFAAAEPSPLEPLPVQVADYALWQRSWLRGAEIDRQLSFWRERLQDSESLELPTDRPRARRLDPRGGRELVILGNEQVATLDELGRRSGATQFMILLAAFGALLHRLSGSERPVVGTPIAGRRQVETEGLIGLFVNTLALPIDLQGDPSFATALDRVRRTTLDAYAHQDLPFEKLVEELQPERDLGNTPIFQVMLVLQNAPEEALELPGATLKPVPLGDVGARFDLALNGQPTDDGLGLALNYRRQLFDATTARRLLAQLTRLLAAAAEDVDCRLSRLPLLSREQTQQLLVEWNDTARDRQAANVHGLIAAEAERRPDAIAAFSEDEALSYRELERRAGRLANALRQRGVEPDMPVAICLERSLEMIVAVIAVLEVGGSYVPLDPDYPSERLAFMLEDAAVPVLLTEQRFADRLPATGAEPIFVDVDWPQIAACAVEPPVAAVGPDHRAYVIYTSGSTGKPKGAMNTHGALVNRLLWLQETYRLTTSDRVLHKTPLSFDVSVWEILWPLTCGAGLFVSRPGGHQDTAYLVDTVARQAITTIHFVPSVLRVFLEESGLDRCSSLRRLIASGEALTRDLEELCDERLAIPRVNMYGPSEAARATYWPCRVPPRRAVAPIGRPIANLTARVVDHRLEPLPIGAAGELLLGGVGVARGYHGRPALTAERFVPDPFATPRSAGGRLYRTGDRVRLASDGDIEFLGRLDHQTKILGVRIEPGEVEAALNEHPAVRESAVLAWKDRVTADSRLVAYFVPTFGLVEGAASAAEIEEIQRSLRSRLPESMVPTSLVALPEMPLTPSGKIDRRALPAPDEERRRGVVAPRNPLEETLAAIWRDVLRVEPDEQQTWGVHDSFFELGGHSLLATRVVSRVRDALAVELPLRSVFEAPTLAELAVEVERARRPGLAMPALTPTRRSPGEAYPLSFAQQRLWILEQMVPGSPLYHIAGSYRLEGPVVVHAMERALIRIVERHEILRTGIHAVDDEPVQIVEPMVELTIPLIDLSSLAVDQRQALAHRIARDEARRPFDLGRAPLLRVRLVRLSAVEHHLLLTQHHIVSDAWSMGLLVREFAELFQAEISGLGSVGTSLPELPIQYRDYALWQQQWLRGEVLEGQLDYWRRQLAGAPEVIALPADHPRPPVPSYRGLPPADAVIRGAGRRSRESRAAPRRDSLYGAPRRLRSLLVAVDRSARVAGRYSDRGPQSQ